MAIKTLDAVIEIPKGSRNKYEWDEKAHRFRFSRMLFTSVQYPADYGYFPDTLAADGDPLDAVVLVGEPTFTGCVVEVRPVGILKIIDGGERDNKVLCVPVSDPHWRHIRKLKQVPVDLLNEIEHFFKVYKNLEKKKVQVQGWGGRKEAVQSIKRAKERFKP